MVIRVHTQDTSSSAVQIAHYIAGEFIRNGYLQGRNRLKEYRIGIHKALLKRHRCCSLKCKLGGVYGMVRTVYQGCLDSNYRISSHGAFHTAFLNTLFHCREVVFRNCATEYTFFKYIRCLQIAGGLKLHLNIAVLSVSAGLLFIFALNLHFLADSLTECKFRLT